MGPVNHSSLALVLRLELSLAAPADPLVDPSQVAGSAAISLSTSAGNLAVRHPRAHDAQCGCRNVGPAWMAERRRTAPYPSSFIAAAAFIATVNATPGNGTPS